MMPLEWAHIRSTARCVLPVLVGPRTAVTLPETRLVMTGNIGASQAGRNDLRDRSVVFRHPGAAAPRSAAARALQAAG